MRKTTTFLFILLSISTFALTSCEGPMGPAGVQGEKGDTDESGKDGISITIGISEDGYWVINGEKTDVKALGAKMAKMAKKEMTEQMGTL